MHKLAEKMADCLKAKVEGMGIDNIEGAALEELGKWVDIIKEIACYDKDMRIIKGMDEAEENEEKMKGYMETMHGIIASLQDRVHIIASHSEELSATSEEIKVQSEHALADSERTNGITVLIKNISQQTNLLGLNASIEAARAGQHGAGFNIVAQEVRKLSSQTASATDQIDDSLMSIKRNIESLKTSMGQISEASSEQAHLVQDFSDIIDELNQLSTEMSTFLKKAL